MNWKWLQHAFAIEPSGPAEPTTLQRDVVEKVCREIVSRGLTVPAILFLETFRPLNLVGAQTFQFFSPWLSVVTHPDGQKHFAEFLENRGSIEFICRRIEQLDTQ